MQTHFAESVCSISSGLEETVKIIGKVEYIEV